jgi:uncharacterized repeat protein (TIGR03833 family)
MFTYSGYIVNCPILFAKYEQRFILYFIQKMIVNLKLLMTMDGTIRKDIKPGAVVVIVQKHHQKTGEMTQGIVKDILTSIPVHPRGIKVRLTTGEVGRVQHIQT